MPVTFDERWDSRKVTTDGDGNVTDAEFVYILRGTADEGVVMSTASESTSGAYLGLWRLGIDLDPVHVDTENAAACIWTVTIKYGHKDSQLPVDNSTISFDTSGGTQHITHSLATRSVAVAGGGTCPLYGNIGDGNGGGAIGVTGDGHVEGVDITVPVYSWSETHALTDAVVQSHQATYYNLTGKVNSVAWKGYQPGEVLFLGADRAKRGDENWEITFKFAASPNKSGLKIGDMTNISKDGWDYLWVLYRDQVHDAAKSLVQRAYAVYVEQVYEKADLGGLGL